MSTATYTEKWDRVTRHAPCPICQRTGYCKVTTDGMIAGCMREPDGAYKTVPTALGEMYLHRLTDEPREPRPPPPHPPPTPPPPPPTAVDRVSFVSIRLTINVNDALSPVLATAVIRAANYISSLHG